MVIDKFPLVSVIIPVFNGEEYLRQAIESALTQEYTNIEILVVDDGSSDDSSNIAKSYGKRLRYFFKENGGVSTALNLGLEQARGQYISWLSHDDLYKPHKIKRQIEELISLDREDVVLYSDWEVIDRRGQKIHKVILERNHELSNLNYALYPLVNSLIHGCTLLIPKKCFEQCGLFNPQLKVTQDYDMWCRIFSTFEVRYIPDTLISYRLHEQQGSSTAPSPTIKKEMENLWIRIIGGLDQNQIIKLCSRQNLAKELKHKSNDYGLPSLMDMIRNQNLRETRIEVSSNQKISVLITLDSPIIPKEEIISILNQSYKNFELLLLITNPFLDKFSLKNLIQTDSRVYIIYAEHLSLPAALNKGLQRIKGDYVAFLEQGCAFAPNKLEKQLKHMIFSKSYLSYTSCINFSDSFKRSVDIVSLFFPQLKNSSIDFSSVMVHKCLLKDKNEVFSEKFPVGYKECFLINLIDEYGYTFLNEDLTFVTSKISSSCLRLEETRLLYESVFKYICLESTLARDYEKLFLLLYKWHSLTNERKRYPLSYKAYLYLKRTLIKFPFWSIMKSKIIQYLIRKNYKWYS